MHLRTLLAVRAGTRKARRDAQLHGHRLLVDFVTNRHTRDAFATGAAAYLRRHGFDGIALHLDNPEDVKWQYLQLLKVRSLCTANCHAKMPAGQRSR